MNTNHTPGPWHINQIGEILVIRGLTQSAKAGFTEDYYGQIAGVRNDTPDAEANARLIAAAPELLDALRIAQHVIHDQVACVDSKYDNARSAISAAIAKATTPQS